jgi:hypothetical protein
MAEDTRRDRVWSTVLEALADGVDHDVPEHAAGGHIPDGIIKSDITPRVKASGRTVHDVLQTMTEYEYLESETHRVYVPTPTGYEIQETTVYTPSADGPLRPFTDTDGSDTAEADRTEENDTETSADGPRYIIGCPECEYETTRTQNSEVVKGVRRRERLCPECETRAELLKDDRPDPPVCPECGEEVIEVKERDEGVTYVHAYEIRKTGMGEMREMESCWVP